MDLKNRLKIDDLKQNISAEDVYHAAQKCFGHLSDGFVTVGYCRDTHRKFLGKLLNQKFMMMPLRSSRILLLPGLG